MRLPKSSREDSKAAKGSPATSAGSGLEGEWIFDRVRYGAAKPVQVAWSADRWIIGCKGKLIIQKLDSRLKIVSNKGSFAIDDDTVRVTVRYLWRDLLLRQRGATLEYETPDEEHGGTNIWIGRRVATTDPSLNELLERARAAAATEAEGVRRKAPKPGGKLVRFVTNPGPADAAGPLRASAGRAPFSIRAVLLDRMGTGWVFTVLDEAPKEPMGYPDEPSTIDLNMPTLLLKPGFVCVKPATEKMNVKVAYAGARFPTQKGKWQSIGYDAEKSWYFEITGVEVGPWSGRPSVAGKATGRVYLGLRTRGAAAAIAGEFTATVRYKASP